VFFPTVPRALSVAAAKSIIEEFRMAQEGELNPPRAVARAGWIKLLHSLPRALSLNSRHNTFRAWMMVRAGGGGAAPPPIAAALGLKIGTGQAAREKRCEIAKGSSCAGAFLGSLRRMARKAKPKPAERLKIKLRASLRELRRPVRALLGHDARDSSRLLAVRRRPTRL
jgi:hypothetical protein